MSTIKTVKRLISIMIIFDFRKPIRIEIIHRFDGRFQIAETIEIRHCVARLYVRRPMGPRSIPIVQIYYSSFVDATNGSRQSVSHEHASEIRHFQELREFLEIHVRERSLRQVSQYDFFFIAADRFVPKKIPNPFLY